jgi:hypothetical protein
LGLPVALGGSRRRQGKRLSRSEKERTCAANERSGEVVGTLFDAMEAEKEVWFTL